MATFQFTRDTSPQQNVSSFLNNNRDQVTGTDVVSPTNYHPQEQNNATLLNAGRKRKFTPDYQQLNNIPSKQPTQQFFCEVCKVQLNSLTQATHHKQGKSHQLNAKKKEILCSMKDSTEQHTNSSDLSCSPIPIILPKAKTMPQGRVDQACIICYKKFNSKTQAEQHFNGQSHRRKLQLKALHHVGKTGENNQIEPTAEEAAAGTLSQGQLMEALSVGSTASETALSSENTGTNELYCEFCRVTLNSTSQMDMHLAGAKHKSSVARSASLPADGDAPMMFHCEDCNVNLNSQNQLVQHLTSPKHLNRVHRHPTAGQFRGAMRGREDGQGWGRGEAASLPTNGDAPIKFYCEDCNVNFNSQKQLEQHLTSPKHLKRVHRHPTAEQLRETMRGRGSGQGRGRGALRGGQNKRGRGGAIFSKPPPIASSFVKANSNMSNMDNQGYPFFPPGQSMNHTPNLRGENPSFQQPFV